MPKTFPKDTEMSDAVYAKSIIEEVWPPELYSRGSIIALAFDGVKAIERSLGSAAMRERKRQWTERRIRSIVDDELPKLERYEVLDLEKMAVKEGRHAYRKSIERAARIATFLAHADEDFHSTEIDAQRSLARALAGSRAGLVTGGASAGGSIADRARELTGGIHRPGTSGGDK